VAGVAGYPEPEFAVANSGESLVVVAGDSAFCEPGVAGANSGERLLILAGDAVSASPSSRERTRASVREAGSLGGFGGAELPQDPQGGFGGDAVPPNWLFLVNVIA